MYITRCKHCLQNLKFRSVALHRIQIWFVFSYDEEQHFKILNLIVKIMFNMVKRVLWKTPEKKYRTVTLTLTLYSFFSWHRWKDAQKTSKIKKFKRQGFLLSTSRKFIHSPLPGKISPSRLPHQIFIPSPPKANSPPPPLNKIFV